MTILVLVRNFVPAHEMIQAGEWNVAEAAKNEYDLEGKVVGTVAVGRIGERVLRRLKPFDCKELLYYDYVSCLSSTLMMIVLTSITATSEARDREGDWLQTCRLSRGDVGPV